MGTVQELPIIAGVELAMDKHGRYNLNALHKAYLEANPHTSKKNKQPADWIKLEGTRELIQEVSNSEDFRFRGDFNSEDLRISPVSSKAGRYGGTYAHELLAVSYAGWISPKFQLQVNQAFLDFKSGKAKKPMSTLEWLEHSLEAEKERLRLEEEKLRLETTVAQLNPKAAALDQISLSKGNHCFTDAAKALKIKPSELIRWLEEKKWVFRRGSNRRIVGFQVRIEQGLIFHRTEQVEALDEFREPYLKTVIQAMITPKGLVKIAEEYFE